MASYLGDLIEPLQNDFDADREWQKLDDVPVILDENLDEVLKNTSPEVIVVETSEYNTINDITEKALSNQDERPVKSSTGSKPIKSNKKGKKENIRLNIQNMTDTKRQQIDEKFALEKEILELKKSLLLKQHAIADVELEIRVLQLQKEKQTP